MPFIQGLDDVNVITDILDPHARRSQHCHLILKQKDSTSDLCINQHCGLHARDEHMGLPETCAIVLVFPTGIS